MNERHVTAHLGVAVASHRACRDAEVLRGEKHLILSVIDKSIYKRKLECNGTYTAIHTYM